MDTTHDGIRVVLVDDHKIVRDGLRLLLEREPGMTVVAEAENGRVAVRLARELHPDVAVMDIAMPELNGIEATRQIVADDPRVRVLALSMHSDRRFVAEMLKAGASGYLLKECAFEELAEAIRTVAAGRAYLSPRIAGIVVQGFVRGPEPEAAPAAGPRLTAREREVMQLLAEGRTTRDVARELHLSAKTVETHRVNLMRKLGFRTLAELTRYAIREGISPLD